MPSSNLAIALDWLALVDQVPHRRVLDIGPGYGKAGLLMSEYFNVKCETIDCVEAERSYITKHRLNVHPWYSDVFCDDAADLEADFLGRYDVVLMVDVIEHIDKARALDLLDRIAGHVVVATPVDFFEQHVAGVPSEDHVSHWTRADFEATGRLSGPTAVCYEHLGALIVRLTPKGTP